MMMISAPEDEEIAFMTSDGTFRRPRGVKGLSYTMQFDNGERGLWLPERQVVFRFSVPSGDEPTIGELLIKSKIVTKFANSPRATRYYSDVLDFQLQTLPEFQRCEAIYARATAANIAESEERRKTREKAARTRAQRQEAEANAPLRTPGLSGPRKGGAETSATLSDRCTQAGKKAVRMEKIRDAFKREAEIRRQRNAENERIMQQRMHACNVADQILYGD